MLSLPLPLPIRDPITFFVIGMWGKVLTQVLRRVMSPLLADFFKKSPNLNIFLLLIRSGFVRVKPTWPNDN